MEHKQENKMCQNCKNEFTIEPEDFNFYEKIKVPVPTWCPQCRASRRFAFQNNWNLYWRKCDNCKEKTLSVYSPDKKIKVFCQKCYWADDWDGTEYGMDYDPNMPFLDQVKELMDITPYATLTSLYKSNKNCEYVNGVAWSKDCYLVFWADFCENVFYSSLLNNLRNSLDCIRGYFSELCYGSIGFSRCYNLFFSDQCDDCLDVWFSRDCYGCTNCIGCVNLRGQKYNIFNKQYTKEEYFNKVKEMKLDSWKSLQQIWQDSYNFWLSKPYREYNGHALNSNVTGEHVYTSKNSKEMYLANGAEDCKYCQFITVPPAKGCMDYSGWGNNAELIYETNVAGENSSSIFFSCECWPDCFDLQYCFWNIAGENNFGCVNLKRKSYCILNKQYPKEEYLKLKEKIIEDMKKNPYIDNTEKKYFYGEFFPPEFSKFPYNKSNAMRFYSKTKEEAIKQGYEWSDAENPTFPITIKSEDLPNTIKETNESILNEVIECYSCSRAFKIVKGEFDFLRNMNLPIPHECPKCRENKRFSRMTIPKLYDRECDKCGAEIRTPYVSNDKRIVYCVKCYQQEVY